MRGGDIPQAWAIPRGGKGTRTPEQRFPNLGEAGREGFVGCARGKEKAARVGRRGVAAEVALREAQKRTGGQRR